MNGGAGGRAARSRAMASHPRDERRDHAICAWADAVVENFGESNRFSSGGMRSGPGRHERGPAEYCSADRRETAIPQDQRLAREFRAACEPESRTGISRNSLFSVVM